MDGDEKASWCVVDDATGYIDGGDECCLLRARGFHTKGGVSLLKGLIFFLS